MRDSPGVRRGGRFEPAVFDALEKEVKTLDVSGTMDKAGNGLQNAPVLAKRKREDLRRHLCEVETQLENLVDCITPENKDLITEKMVALRQERDKLKTEFADTDAIEAKAVASTKLVSRMMKLATELNELWSVARLEEKRELVSFLIKSVSICHDRKTAEIELTSKYAELKRIAAPEDAAFLLTDGRGDWI